MKTCTVYSVQVQLENSLKKTLYLARVAIARLSKFQNGINTYFICRRYIGKKG